MKKIVIGNWKMNGTIKEIVPTLKSLLCFYQKNNIDTKCVIMPPYIYIPLVMKYLINSVIEYGSQNIYPEYYGSYTGEISLSMLKDYGCKYVLVGHSERRNIFNEKEELIVKKFFFIKNNGMIPIFCIGENGYEKENNLEIKSLKRQLLSVLNVSNNCFENCIIAYEPIWAIGTGKSASFNYISKIHTFIRNFISTFNVKYSSLVPIIYGGGINTKNAKCLFKIPNVNGGIIGSASLKIKSFLEIITSCII